MMGPLKIILLLLSAIVAIPSVRSTLFPPNLPSSQRHREIMDIGGVGIGVGAGGLGSCSPVKRSEKHDYYDNLQTSKEVYYDPHHPVTRISTTGDDYITPVSYDIRHLTTFLDFTTKNTETGRPARLDTAFAALLAVYHFNNQIDEVVPQLRITNRTCPKLRFTMDFLDTGRSPVVASRRLLENVLNRFEPDYSNYARGRYPPPTAIVGTGSSEVSAQLAILGSVYGLPQVSHGATSDGLDNKGQYPLFGRMLPSNAGDAKAGVEYLTERLGVRHLCVLYLRDEYGKNYARNIQEAASKRGVKVVTANFAETDSYQIRTALEQLKASGYRYFYGIFFKEEWEIVMQEASQLGLTGPGYFWLFGDAVRAVLSSFTLFKNETLANAGIAGHAVISIATPDVLAEEASSKAFKRLWTEAVNDRKAMDNFLLKIWMSTRNNNRRRGRQMEEDNEGSRHDAATLQSSNDRQRFLPGIDEVGGGGTIGIDSPLGCSGVANTKPNKNVRAEAWDGGSLWFDDSNCNVEDDTSSLETKDINGTSEEELGPAINAVDSGGGMALGDAVTDPSPFVYLMYDTIIALALASCEATRVGNVNFTGAELYHTFLAARFEGAYGRVDIDSTTGSREYETVRYAITNFVEVPSEDNVTVAFVLNTTDIYEVGKKCSSEGAQWKTISPFVFADGTTVRPDELPPVDYTIHYVSDGAKAFCLILCTIVILTSVAFALWTIKHRKTRVVAGSQPVFLLMICGGAFIMGCAVIPMSIDEESSGVSKKGLDIACMAIPWCFSIGFVVCYSALISKMMRVNKLFNSRSHCRVTVSPRDVMKPFVALTTMTLGILISWTVISPLKYQLVETDSKDKYNRNIEAYATCYGDGSFDTSRIFLILLLVMFIVSLLFANYQSYLARHISLEFSESRYIAISQIIMLQPIIIGTPILIFASDSPSPMYIVQSMLLLIISCGVLLPIFVPKFFFMREWRKKEAEKAQKRKEKAQRNKDFETRITQQTQQLSTLSSTESSFHDEPIHEPGLKMIFPSDTTVASKVAQTSMKENV